jgi:hypothetical protein
MLQTDATYWYGLSAAAYIVTCWLFAAIRYYHTCRAPKEHRSYIWPDRKLQVIIYMMATTMLPYVMNPDSLTAWTLWKSYFPATYYFYSGLLLFCFFGSVKQWNRWKTASWIAAIITIVTMAPLVMDAWIPGGMMNANVARYWGYVVCVVSIGMMGYCMLAMWQVTRWMREARYVNTLRLNYYEQYMAKHPNTTKETAAQESGFSSYVAYYKVKDRLERG